MSDQDRIAELEHRLRETNSMLARLADVVKRMATEVRDLPGVNRSSPAWRDVEEIVRDIDRARGR
jgi:Mg2+ and Co2+ transporter CorA